MNKQTKIIIRFENILKYYYTYLANEPIILALSSPCFYRICRVSNDFCIYW